MATAKTKSTNGAAPAQFDEAFDAGFRAAETALKSNTEAALKGYDRFVVMSREALDAASKAGKDVKGFDQAIALPKANFEAFVEAGNAVVRGLETFNGRFFDLARAQVAEGVAAQKALMGAKTFQEVVGIQQDFVRRTFDRAVQDGVELSSAWVKVATEAAQPISQQASDTVAQMSRKAA